MSHLFTIRARQLSLEVLFCFVLFCRIFSLYFLHMFFLTSFQCSFLKYFLWIEMCAENRFVSCKSNDIVVFFHTCSNTCGSIKVNVSPRQTFISTQSNKLVILQIPFSWRSHSFNRFQQLRARNNRRNYFSLSKMNKKIIPYKNGLRNWPMRPL